MGVRLPSTRGPARLDPVLVVTPKYQERRQVPEHRGALLAHEHSFHPHSTCSGSPVAGTSPSRRGDRGLPTPCSGKTAEHERARGLVCDERRGLRCAAAAAHRISRGRRGVSPTHSRTAVVSPRLPGTTHTAGGSYPQPSRRGGRRPGHTPHQRLLLFHLFTNTHKKHARNETKAPHPDSAPRVRRKTVAATYSPTPPQGSTISTKRLNDRVRKETGCDPPAMTTTENQPPTRLHPPTNTRQGTTR